MIVACKPLSITTKNAKLKPVTMWEKNVFSLKNLLYPGVIVILVLIFVSLFNGISTIMGYLMPKP